MQITTLAQLLEKNWDVMTGRVAEAQKISDITAVRGNFAASDYVRIGYGVRGNGLATGPEGQVLAKNLPSVLTDAVFLSKNGTVYSRENIAKLSSPMLFEMREFLEQMQTPIEALEFYDCGESAVTLLVKGTQAVLKISPVKETVVTPFAGYPIFEKRFTLKTNDGQEVFAKLAFVPRMVRDDSIYKVGSRVVPDDRLNQEGPVSELLAHLRYNIAGKELSVALGAHNIHRANFMTLPPEQGQGFMKSLLNKPQPRAILVDKGIFVPLDSAMHGTPEKPVGYDAAAAEYTRRLEALGAGKGEAYIKEVIAPQAQRYVTTARDPFEEIYRVNQR